MKLLNMSITFKNSEITIPIKIEQDKNYIDNMMEQLLTNESAIYSGNFHLYFSYFRQFLIKACNECEDYYFQDYIQELDKTTMNCTYLIKRNEALKERIIKWRSLNEHMDYLLKRGRFKEDDSEDSEDDGRYDGRYSCY